MRSADESEAAGGPADGPDHVLRAITTPDDFRVIVADTTQTVRQAIAKQQAEGAAARNFADLLTGAVLIRETMSPSHRVEAVLRTAGSRGRLIADAHPDGRTRGLVQLGEGNRDFSLEQGGILQMMRSMAHGHIHKSVVHPPPGSDVSLALMTYLQQSEQISSVIAVGAHRRDGDIVHAGGFVVQLLPGARREALARMTARLETLPPIDELLLQHGGQPELLLGFLLDDVAHTQLGDSPLHFGCQCSQQAVVASLATLKREDIAELLRDSDVLELSCDYCRTDYRVARAVLQGLLEPS